jgi:glycogen/starch/alpha-glucan phosphorylases
MESIKDSYSRYLRYILAKDNLTATRYDKFMALSYAVRSEIIDRWIETQASYHNENMKRVYLLSMEHMFGRNLKQNIINLDIEKHVFEHTSKLGFLPEDLYEQEDPFDLGNGGKGRLVACMQDAMATLGIAGTAYGLRYDFAAFRQEIKNNAQVERPYDWLHKGHPWEIIRPEYRCEISFYGKSERAARPDNPLAGVWNTNEKVIAIPYDFPVPGYKNRTVNTLRLWASRASEEFLSDYVNHGDYLRACEDLSRSGTVAKVLFPEEDVLRATELRLKQNYFLVAASLFDIVRRFKRENGTMTDFNKKVVIQLTGSNCALAVPELMRLLVDVENIPWKTAWDITKSTFAYTSVAVSKEGLETWPVYMMTQVLPRHMEIIYEINQNHLDEVRTRFGNREDLVREISVIQEGEVKRVRLANLALLGSFSANGVSMSQTENLKKNIFPEFNVIHPEKFQNKTNGISHRRWVLSANRPLAELINKAIGDSWIRKPENLSKLEPFAEQEDFLDRLAHIKHDAKKNLSLFIKKQCGIDVQPESLFDVHCRKIHPYKRQVLHVLNILSRYVRIKNGESAGVPRVHVFAGKAAPSDQLAKQIIKLINVTASIVNGDAAVADKIKVVFLPDYDVSMAEKIVPAADISEQIATPGQEACGTGNIKFAINGALIIASKGGSNLELIERIGTENMVVFGKDIAELPAFNRYQPYETLAANKNLSAVFSLLEDRLKNIPQNGLSINPLLSTLKDSDRYYVLLDFDDYAQKQDLVDSLFTDRPAWLKRSLITIARSGWFSIDRTVAGYARDIWNVLPR